MGARYSSNTEIHQEWQEIKFHSPEELHYGSTPGSFLGVSGHERMRTNTGELCTPQLYFNRIVYGLIIGMVNHI